MKKQVIFFIIICFLNVSMLLPQQENENQFGATGRFYLVLIANNTYTYWHSLNRPIIDVNKIREILERNYIVDQVIPVFNSNRKQILDTFRMLCQRTSTNDSVLIFYSGHGAYEPESDTGFWIPVDGGADREIMDKWIPNSQIQGYVKNMRARHVLLLVDSCFSGSFLTRGMPVVLINNELCRKAYSRSSRQVLTAGNLEEVNEDSEFARQLAIFLEENKDKYLDPDKISKFLRSSISESQPQYGELKGHVNGGSFLFIKRDITRGIAEETEAEISFDSHIFNSKSHDKIILNLGKIPKNMQFYFSGSLKNLNKSAQTFFIDAAGVDVSWENNFKEIQVGPDQSEDFSFYLNPEIGQSTSKIIFKINNMNLFEIELKYETLETEILKEVNSGKVISGNMKEFSPWYELSLGKAPEGYTLILGTEEFLLTGDRECGKWAECRWKSKNDEDLSVLFRLQGHDENEPFARYSEGHLKAKYKLIQNKPQISIFNESSPKN